jgi:hypothetical protein
LSFHIVFFFEFSSLSGLYQQLQNLCLTPSAPLRDDCN